VWKPPRYYRNLIFEHIHPYPSFGPPSKSKSSHTQYVVLYIQITYSLEAVYLVVVGGAPSPTFLLSFYVKGKLPKEWIESIPIKSP